MKKSVFIVLFVLISWILLPPVSHARPTKPGPNFVWVAPERQEGDLVKPGYWSYTGPKQAHRVWVEAHYNSQGEWIPGQWVKSRAGNFLAPAPGKPHNIVPVRMGLPGLRR